MAYIFPSTNTQSLSAEINVVQNQTYLTVSCMFFRNQNSTMQVVGSNDNFVHRTTLLHYSDNNIYATVANGSNFYGFCSVTSLSGWNHYCMVFDGTKITDSDKLKLYVNGNLQTLFYGGTAPASSSNLAENRNFIINYYGVANQYGSGSYAELGIWQNVLNPSEINSLAKGMTPDKIRPQNLAFYAPLVRELVDTKGNLTITNNNGATVANHPRVYK